MEPSVTTPPDATGGPATGSPAPGAPTAADPPPEPSAPDLRGGEALVEIRDLRKHYGPIRAVDGISFTVRRGDIVGFLGPNGAGKTTAMRILTGFLEPDGGSVRVAGFDLAEDSLSARERIGYLPENAPAYGEMTVDGFLRFVAQARRVEGAEAALERVVAQAGLHGVRHQAIDTLSKGYKRRVGLAQALIHDPEVLVLDEPTDGLDPNQKAMVQELIGNLSPTKCIVLSTHILDEVERVCNRAIIIDRGRILVDSTPDQLIRQAPGHASIRVELADDARPEDVDAFAERLAAAPWCAGVERPEPAVVEARPDDGRNHVRELLELAGEIPIADLVVREGHLADLFRQLTEESHR